MLEKLKNISALSYFGKKASTMLGVDIFLETFPILAECLSAANASRLTELLIFITPKIITEINVR